MRWSTHSFGLGGVDKRSTRNSRQQTSIVWWAAKKAVLMIGGQEERETLAAVMNEPPDFARFSVQLLWPILDRVTWSIDHAAAPRFLWGADGIA